ncbi:MAG: hypothetical protein ACI9R3_005076 [Verrucomicrobiales bacterium]|jgi:hypothetical protein
MAFALTVVEQVKLCTLTVAQRFELIARVFRELEDCRFFLEDLFSGYQIAVANRAGS